MSQVDPAAPSSRLVAPEEAELADDASYDARMLARLLPYLRPHATLLGFAFLLMPVTAGAALLQPYLIKLALDAALVDRTRDALFGVVLVFAGAILVEFIARFAQVYLMQLAGQRATADLRAAVFSRIQRLPMRYFDRTPVGRIVTRVTNDIDSLTELFSSGAVTAISDLLMLVGIVAFMIYLDGELTLVALMAIPPLALLVAVFRRYAREAFRSVRYHIARLNSYLAEQIQGITVVQAFGREPDCAEEYRRINQAHRDANHRAIRFDALLYSVVESVSVACVAAVLWYAGAQAGSFEDPLRSAAYVGTVVAFYEYIHRFFIPIRDLSTKYTIIQHSLAAAERIFGVLDEPDAEAELGQAHPEAAPLPDAIEPGTLLALRGISFAYRQGHPVLHDLDLDIHRGETLALVGATGSGKTTITALLLRLYEVQQGRIWLDGVELREIPAEQLRARFSVVPQDVFLFAGTVLENIALGDREPDVAKVREALSKVGAAPMVEAKGGLQAPVLERGANFSAGERQLLAFARALYLDRELLILDEATASVDSETEARLQEAVGTLLEGRTALVIAHRLSTVRTADRIVVMHQGRIVEVGTHAELLALEGFYARLYRLHFDE